MAENNQSNIKNNFDENKASTQKLTKGFLENTANAEGLLPGLDSMKLTNGNFTEILQSLEVKRDKRNGIILYRVTDNNTSVLIRDARDAKPIDKQELGPEAFQMNYINATRAAIDILDMHGQNRDEIKSELIKLANTFIETTNNQYDELKRKHKNDKEPQKKPQEALAKLVKEANKNLGQVLENNAQITDVYKKINVAKDFQNFNDPHSNIVTLTKFNDTTVIETEVAIKELTTEQKQDLISITTENPPGWFKALQPYEQALTLKYVNEIISGKHVIPTQLRQLPGLKNAWEKTTSIADNTNKVTILHSALHTGTIASLNKTKQPRVKEKIVNHNVAQLKAVIGSSTLHVNSLNSGGIKVGNFPGIGVGADRKIVTQIINAGRNNQNFHVTNTAFNFLRRFSSANDYSGVTNTLQTLVDNLSKVNAFDNLNPGNKDIITTYLKNGDGNNVSYAEAIKGIKDKNKDLHNALEQAGKLRSNLKKVNTWYRRIFDSDNRNLDISTSLHKLNTVCQKIKTSQGDKLLDERTVTMCASGKDRTGLAMLWQSLNEVESNIKTENPEVTKEGIGKALLGGRHTAQQAGGVFSGGATIGAFGTKKENIAGIPKTFLGWLKDIVESQSAKLNKFKGKSKINSKRQEKINNDKINENINQQIGLFKEKQSSLNQGMENKARTKSIAAEAIPDITLATAQAERLSAGQSKASTKNVSISFNQ